MKMTASRSACPGGAERAGQEAAIPAAARHLGPAQGLVQRDVLEIGVGADPRVTLVGHPAGGGVTADQAAQEAGLIVGGLLRRLGEVADPVHPVADRHGGQAGLGRADVPPAAVGEEAVVAAGDQPGPVGQQHPERRLRRGPVIADRGGRVPPVGSGAHRAHHRVAGADLGQRPGRPVGHQDRGVPAEAVRTRVRAAPVRIHRPAEGHAGGPGHLVDDRFGLDLVEGHALEGGGVEGANGGPGSASGRGVAPSSEDG